MKQFDYIRDSVDFCLYTNEVISRFAGQDVIVYATHDEGKAFADKFKSQLNIKYVANMMYSIKNKNFVLSPALSLEEGKPPIKNIDGLLAIRKSEPIFALSRRRWVELLNYLEGKGLVLGENIFFWEQGYPKTELIQKFIDHNVRLWQSEKIESDNRVLVPLSSSKPWFEAGRSVPNAYVGNYLAKLYNARIGFCFHATTKSRELMYRHRTSRDIWRSFNATDTFEVSCEGESLKKAKEIFDSAFPKINNWHDLSQFKIDGLNFGNLFIRDFCRYYVPALDLKSKKYQEHFFWAIKHVVALSDYFKHHDDIKAIVLCDGVTRSGYLRDIAVSNGIPTYALDYGSSVGRLDIGWPNNRHYEHYKEFFNQLSPKEQAIGLEWAKRSLEARLHGDTKDISYMETSIYSVKPSDRVLEQNDKIKLLICPHTLYDEIHCGWSVFGSMIEWLIHLGELSNTTDYDWYLKKHPNSLKRDDKFYNAFVKRYPRIKLVPQWTSPKQLKAEGVKFAFTIYGTLGHEYPALGIQVINAGNNPHIAFDFCYNPKTSEEFDDIVAKLPELADRDVDMQEIYQFYCINYLYYKKVSRPVQNIFFRRPELYKHAWIATKQINMKVSEVVKRFQYYLDDWTPDFHEITKRKVEDLFHEMDTHKDDVFYRQDETVLKQKLAAVGMSLD